MTTTPQSPDRNAAADVLIQRVRNNIEAHRKSLPDDWQDFIAEQVRDINAALAALRAGGEPVATGDNDAIWLLSLAASFKDIFGDGHAVRELRRIGLAMAPNAPSPAAALPERAGGGEAFRDSALSSARFRAACYRLVGIVEGVEGMGRRWAANGERLKDTPEWVAFYNAAADMRNGRSFAIPHFADRHEFIHHKADCYTLNGGSGGDEDCNCGAVAFGDALDSLAAQPAPGVVSEAMVERAMDAWDGAYDGVAYIQRADAMRAALTAALNAPPAADGMVVVPREPTPFMMEMGAHWIARALTGIDTDECDSAENVWIAMIAAAPRQDGAEGVG
jgi:hypothetical protein